MSLAWEHAGELPTIPAPLGVVSNFNNPVSLHKYDVLTQSVCLTITTLLVCMRIWTKGVLLRRLGWDDYSSVAAWLGLVVYAILNLVEDGYGAGRHLWDVKGKDFTVYMKLVNVSQIIYSPIIFVVKLSIVLLFLRVFAPRQVIRITLHLVLWTNLLFYIAGTFVEIFQCAPRMKIWYPLVPGKCINESAAQLASGVFNTVSDFAILIIPIISVWGLQLPAKQKWGLTAVFGTGLLGCVASLIRMVIIIQKSRHVVLDGTWEWYPLNLWTSAEISCGIICGCLQPLPAFARFLMGKPPQSGTSKSAKSRNSVSLPTIHIQARKEGKNDDWEELIETK